MTWLPGVTTSVFGFTPAEVIVTVSDPEGAVGTDPAGSDRVHAVAARPSARTAKTLLGIPFIQALSCFRVFVARSSIGDGTLDEIDPADAEVSAEHAGGVAAKPVVNH